MHRRRFPDCAGIKRNPYEPSFQEMLSFVLSRRMSTRLTVRKLNITLYIHEGRLEAASGYVHLGDVLVGQGVIEPDVRLPTLTPEESFGHHLLRQRRITGLQLRNALRQQAQETLLFLLPQPDLDYDLQDARPLPVPNANLEGQELLTQMLAQQPLSMRTAYQLSDVKEAVSLEPACWQLLRWINGRRTLGRVIELAALPLEAAQEAARSLLQRGLIEQTPVLGLRFIVPRRLPLDSTKHPPGGIRANLFLRHIDGQRSVWDIREKLACPPEEVIEHLTKRRNVFLASGASAKH